MYYTRLTVECEADYSEILMAELAEIGFDTFLENESGFEAYVEEDRFDKKALADLKEKYSAATELTFAFARIEKKNWNEEWEKNYQPIIVDERCLIRASFHKIPGNYPYEIVITPKMSFGTGHHQTTYLMIRMQMDMDHKDKRVMDAGCGTAILSVMACKLGAAEVEAFDIDEWSVINGKENIDVNGCSAINIQQGKISEVKLDGKFDIVLANINKNVLLDEIGKYVGFMKPESVLLISGFYTHDIPDLLAAASKYKLKEIRRSDRETWATLLLGF